MCGWFDLNITPQQPQEVPDLHVEERPRANSSLTHINFSLCLAGDWSPRARDPRAAHSYHQRPSRENRQVRQCNIIGNKVTKRVNKAFPLWHIVQVFEGRTARETFAIVEAVEEMLVLSKAVCYVYVAVRRQTLLFIAGEVHFIPEGIKTINIYLCNIQNDPREITI